MKKYEFQKNFFTAYKLYRHSGAATNGVPLDPQQLARVARASVWLAPVSVRGFDAADFADLGPEQQRQLAEVVREFLEVAQQVPPTEPPTAEQLVRGKTAFEKMLAALAPFPYLGADTEKMERIIQSVELPDWAVNWDFEVETDPDWNPGITAYLYSDEKLEPAKIPLVRSMMDWSRKAREALAAEGIQQWVFDRIRGMTEHKSK